MIIKSCCICLSEGDTLQTLNSTGDNEVKLTTKLIYIAPEYEWLEIFSICAKCNIQLENAYNFKQLCSTHNSFRKKLSEQANDSFDEEHIIETESVYSICEASNPNQFKNQHTNTGIFELEKFICYHCNTNFQSKILLQSHIGIKHGNICRVCTNVFDTKKELRIHKQNEHKKKLSAKFQCEICNEKFSLLKSILNHCISVHLMKQKDVKPYCCNQCNNKFTSSTLLIQHKKYHNGDRAFVCTTCGKSFITRRDLNGHEKLHDNQRNYSCDKCEKHFNTSQNLKTHIYVVHTDSSQWKYSCPICSKRFAMKTNCNEHVKRHQGSKDFVCHICKKTFVSNHEVKRHVKLHSNISPYKCSLCPKHYRDKRYLNLHLSKLHGVGSTKPPVRIKKYFCHICPSQFFDNPKLQRHLRTHTGIKPFSCQECDKRFIEKSYLSHHLKSVHNIVSPLKVLEQF